MVVKKSTNYQKKRKRKFNSSFFLFLYLNKVYSYFCVMRQVLIWIIFLLILFISSYYREVLFRSINAVIDGEEFFYAKTMELPLLYDWTKYELLRLKYILTVLFTFWFALISCVGIKFSFQNSIAYLTLLGFYLILALIALISMIFIYFIGFEKTYPFLRLLIGAIHNPVPYMLISIGAYSFKKSTTDRI